MPWPQSRSDQRRIRGTVVVHTRGPAGGMPVCGSASQVLLSPTATGGLHLWQVLLWANWALVLRGGTAATECPEFPPPGCSYN
jgi:hypothetical protein